MSNYAKWLLADKADDKDAGGCYVPASVTGAAVATFGAALAAFSDGVLAKTELHALTAVNYAVPTAGATIERTGLIVIQNVNVPEMKYNIAIPALNELYIDPNGDANNKIEKVCCDSILTSWLTLTGNAAADYKVVRSSVYYRK